MCYLYLKPNKATNKPLIIGNDMNNSIFNSLHSFTNAVRDDVKEAMGNFSEAELYEMDASDLLEYMQENHYMREVIYYSDAWDVVTSSQFNGYDADYLDFSSCKGALECVMQEANGIIYSSYHSIAYELAIDMLNDAHEAYEANLSDDEA